MISAVFDCNVFLQALLNPNGIAANCLDSVEKNKVRLFVSKATIEEVRVVFLRPNIMARFNGNSKQVEAFIENILSIAVYEKSVPSKFKFQRDPKDEMIINLALFAEVNYIVSRDKDLLDLMSDVSAEAKEFRQKSRPLKIVEPIKFLKVLEQENISLKP